MENPPQSPFVKGGSRPQSPLCKRGVGGISSQPIRCKFVWHVTENAHGATDAVIVLEAFYRLQPSPNVSLTPDILLLMTPRSTPTRI